MAKMMPFMVLSVLVALLTASAALDPSLDMAWEEWKGLHRKGYLEGEEASRRAVWEDNLRMIEQHNWEASLGKHTYQLGMNHFGDLTNEEFNQMYGFLPDEVEPAVGNVSFFHELATEEVPQNVDWREKGYITRVKNQGKCGSCWAFSATGALEGFYFKKHKNLVSFSEQNLLDCSQKQGKNGCKGGYAKQALYYVKQNGGLSSDNDYPYKARVGKCRRNVRKIGIKIKSIVQVQPRSEKALEYAVATIGPISVVTSCSSKELQFYKSGIFSSESGEGKGVHAMLVVGYRTISNEKSYWILKNSYSETWGIKGYLYMLKGFNRCGIANRANYPV